ncbi:MAG: hypothetical protein AB1757_30435 [Acidobacteriota bacterium]
MIRDCLFVVMLCATGLCVQVCLAQQKSESSQHNLSIKLFNAVADHHSDTLLFKALQYTAPYPGYYQELILNKDGSAYNARVVPDWAVQDSKGAKLSESQLDEIKQVLVMLNLKPASSMPTPSPGVVHTVFVFDGGKGLARYDYIGLLPAEVQSLLDLIHSEIEKQERVKYEEGLERRKHMQQVYGEWQNKLGVVIPSDSRMHSLKGANGLLLTIGGRRASESKFVDVSIYHVLIFYPEASLTGSGGGGGWSDEPLSTNVIIWSLHKEPAVNDQNMSEKRLELKYNAIDKTLSVGSREFSLNQGNLFIIQMNDDWAPIVRQGDTFIDEQMDDQKVLDYFKSVFPQDGVIQYLKLT